MIKDKFTTSQIAKKLGVSHRTAIRMVNSHLCIKHGRYEVSEDLYDLIINKRSPHSKPGVVKNQEAPLGRGLSKLLNLEELEEHDPIFKIKEEHNKSYLEKEVEFLRESNKALNNNLKNALNVMNIMASTTV